MSKKKTIIISDIHMGINIPTNWYQQSIHEKYLSKILEWVIDHKEDVDEFIILGDLFDFWTFAPNEKPANAQQIIDANPNILGPTGLISQVLDALEGRVIYVLGNHDITATKADVELIGSSKYKVQFQQNFHQKNEVLYTHGHLYTMFNAPDITNNLPLPVGHFVTRAISYLLKKKSESASQILGFGADNIAKDGLESALEQIVQDILLQNKVDGKVIVNALLADIKGGTGISNDTPIKMKGDLATKTFGEIKGIYNGLFDDWVAKYSDGGRDLTRGLLFAYKAAMADQDGTYLGWFAQKIAFEKNAELVVMGHTHSPRKGLDGGVVDYLNTGFECVPVPGMEEKHKHMTFGVVTTSDGKYVDADVMAVEYDNGFFSIANENPPKAKIFSEETKEIGGDYSCYVTVENNSDEEYVIVSKENTHGYFVTKPPERILKNQTVKFWLQDFPGPAGSQGKVVYKGRTTGQLVPLSFRCTTFDTPGIHINPNQCNGTNEFYTKAINNVNAWSEKNHLVQEGHPFFSKFVLHNNNGNSFKLEGGELVAEAGTCLKPGEFVTVNGRTDLSDIIVGADGAKVFSIKMNEHPSASELYAYELLIDGQGQQSRIKAKSLFVHCVDQSNDNYSKMIYASKRDVHELSYNSNAPNIIKIFWEMGFVD